ncbi:cytochrome C [Novosphingobium sp. PC22D]|uniref:cytochrome c3 family protein n=1 Tax=Novosphingobium sp. PC22D TaxID=1962403 RepID=UPI000BEF6DA3|nr:cytochrome c3 family protein [Novosphingobium sp. PC22D]PEQ10663.1 cytochrome C [Novosphingobium sp. PC22D]
MAFKLRSIDVTATGREIVRDTDLAGSAIIIGRSADCDIHLPDLALEARHARATLLEGGRVEIRALGTLGFSVDGTDTLHAEIDPQIGAELGFATYRITIAREDGDVLLTVRKSASIGGDLEEKQGFSLAGVLPSKRWISWGFALVILLAFLAVPIISHATRDVAARQKVIGDKAWSTGELSLAHHSLENSCESCHVDAFVSVRDETCKSCHKTIHDHADRDKLLAAHGRQPLGTRFLYSVGGIFGKEGQDSCSDCHTEHEGPVELQAENQQFCADCHADLKSNLAGTALGNASDFGKVHPQFSAAIVTDPQTKTIKQVSLDSTPREDNGLTFPHKLHLDPKGGVARMAANIGDEHGYGSDGMQCKDCHHATKDGVRFVKVDMERDCEACHSLSFDEVGGQFRKLHHGDVDKIIAELNSADISRPLPNPRRRPGLYADGPYQFSFSAPVWQGLQWRTALSPRGVCGECHRPDFEDGKPGVLPVTLQTRYFHDGWFDHGPHKQEKCATCHLADASTANTDLLLPGVKDCRTCHLGEDAKAPKTPSTCAMCHGYHTPGQGVLSQLENKKTARTIKKKTTKAS